VKRKGHEQENGDFINDAIVDIFDAFARQNGDSKEARNQTGENVEKTHEKPKVHQLDSRTCAIDKEKT
jgi:hypothetical protein